MTTDTSPRARPAGAAAPPASEDFQVPTAVAEAYEAEFVPALFQGWADLLVDALAPRPGERLLDVACGTGVVARTAAERTPGLHVEGCDLNPAMLAVARRLRPDVRWVEADAAALPHPDGSADVVTCQAALMFFPDPAAALREAARVAGPEGRVGLVVVGRLASCPAYVELAEIVQRQAGAGPADLVRGYFSLGDPERLAGLLRDGGLEPVVWRTVPTDFRRASVDEFVTTEAESTPLRSRLDDDTYARVRSEAAERLPGLVRHPDAPDGGVAVNIEVHVVVARAAG